MRQVSSMVPFSDIITDEHARRVGETEVSLTSLKESIRTLGLLDPLIVEEVSGGKKRLCAGRSRYKCLKSLREEGDTSFNEVPCTVLEFDEHELVDENYKLYKIAQVIFDSNDKRTALTKLEQARHYREQMQKFPHLFPNFIEVARFNNKDVSEVKEALDLLAIDPVVMLRIEELNLQTPGTIPGMCIQEIARFSADLKRPLPPEGQMEVIEELTSPDLADKRALILRDKMEALVKRIRNTYVPETRGRKRADTTANGTETRGANSSSASDTSENVATEGDLVIDQAVSRDNGASSGEGDQMTEADSGGSSAVTSSSGPARAEESYSTSSDRSGSSSLNIGIIEANMRNIASLLHGGTMLDHHEYERLSARWQEINQLLEQAALQPA
jgi:hypothetical protein